LRDDAGQHWFGFEVTGSEGQPIGPFGTQEWPPLHVEGSRTVTQEINLTPLYPIQDLGSYHIRAHVYFADLDQYFYSPSKVVQITDARPIWKQTVGVPETSGTARDTRS